MQDTFLHTVLHTALTLCEPFDLESNASAFKFKNFFFHKSGLKLALVTLIRNHRENPAHVATHFSQIASHNNCLCPSGGS